MYLKWYVIGNPLDSLNLTNKRQLTSVRDGTDACNKTVAITRVCCYWILLKSYQVMRKWMYDNIVKILTILVIVIMICILTSYFNLMLKLMMLFLFTLLQERGLRRQCKVYYTPILTIINVILMFVSLLSWLPL